MKDYEAWESIKILLVKLQYQEICEENDPGNRKKICPVCKSESSHDAGCELDDAISTIGTMLDT
jgi:hypothetical protein